MGRFLALLLSLFLLAACATTPPVGERPLTILVSIDGFRPDYLDRGVTPVLSGLAAGGVRGTMRPSFPSKTFPNHYTLVTGLRPDRNGIVDNNMEDRAIPEVPARYHFGRNPRVPAIVCLPQVGWMLSTRDYKPARPERGAHGFDPESPEMAAVFVANGPAFRRSVVLPAFDNVSVYPLLARLVGVRPAPNDGRARDTEPALAH